MNIGRNWLVAALLAALVLGAPQAQANPPAQNTWLAATAETGGNAGLETMVFGTVPNLIVYANGTAVWSDPSKMYKTDRIDPETWRTGTVSRDALKQFQATVETNKFFTIQPHPVAPTAGPGGMSVGVGVGDGTTTHVAVQFGGRKRIVEEYALNVPGQFGKDEAYLKVIAATRDAVLALKPAQSKLYKPATIRVGVFDTFNAPAGIPWPLDGALAPTEQNRWLLFSGDRARTVMETLARSAYIASQGHVYHVVWVPALDIPANPVTTEDKKER